jgi:hypothetical protein
MCVLFRGVCVGWEVFYPWGLWVPCVLPFITAVAATAIVVGLEAYKRRLVSKHFDPSAPDPTGCSFEEDAQAHIGASFVQGAALVGGAVTWVASVMGPIPAIMAALIMGTIILIGVGTKGY